MTNLPSTELGAVRRLQVLAASIPGAAYDETVVQAPFESLWAFVSDMDTSMPRLFPNFRTWRTAAHHGDHLQAAAVGYLGQRGVFDVTLKPGLCIMQDRRFIGGIAAQPGVTGTRFALLAAPRGPARHLGAPLRPLAQRLLRRSARRLGTHLTT